MPDCQGRTKLALATRTVLDNARMNTRACDRSMQSGQCGTALPCVGDPPRRSIRLVDARQIVLPSAGR
eukprot:6178756-Pleurochrysis_carterae.AAC.3